jgi:hypothetical protein
MALTPNKQTALKLGLFLMVGTIVSTILFFLYCFLFKIPSLTMRKGKMTCCPTRPLITAEKCHFCSAYLPISEKSKTITLQRLL